MSIDDMAQAAQGTDTESVQAPAKKKQVTRKALELDADTLTLADTDIITALLSVFDNANLASGTFMRDYFAPAIVEVVGWTFDEAYHMPFAQAMEVIGLFRTIMQGLFVPKQTAPASLPITQAKAQRSPRGR